MSDQHESSEGKVLSFTDHLQELRIRIIICLGWFVGSFLLSFYFAPSIVFFLMQPLMSVPRDQQHGLLTLYLARSGEVSGWTVVPPLDTITTPTIQAAEQTTAAIATLATDSIRVIVEGFPHPIEIGPKTGTRLTYLTPLEPFFLWLQGALLLSSVFTIPMLIYQFWLFISPGLLKSERGVIKPLLLASILLFPMGAAFAYGISHVILKALMSFGDSIPFLEPNLVASRYLSFILIMMFMFGLVFEFPLVLLLMSRLGFVGSETLVRQRKIAIVAMAVIASVATPSPDPFSMLLMLAPLILLYEGSVAAIKFMERRDRAREAAEAS